MRYRTLALAFLLGLLLLVPVEGVLTATDEYSTSNADGSLEIVAVYPGTGQNTAQGQAFTASHNAPITHATFFLKREPNVVNVVLKAYLYALTGTYGTSAKPDGSAALATSDDFDANQLGTSVCSGLPPAEITWRSYTITFPPNSYSLVKGETYGISLQATSGSFNSQNLCVGFDNTASTHDGNGFYYNTAAGGWDWGSADAIFSVGVDFTETFTGGSTDDSQLGQETPPRTLPTGPLAGGIGALVILAGFVAFAFSRRKGR